VQAIFVPPEKILMVVHSAVADAMAKPAVTRTATFLFPVPVALM
jgi:hypothetical protein